MYAARDVQPRAETQNQNQGARAKHNFAGQAKRAILQKAFVAFKENELKRKTARAKEFIKFTEEESHWLDDYALFHALLEHFNKEWREWPEDIRTRNPEALRRYSEQFSDEILFFKYLQWLYYVQRLEIRSYARAKGVFLLGDLPMYPALDSADVWSHQELFEFDKSNGAPPDQFSPDKQQYWGSIPYAWATKYDAVLEFWLRRIRHSAKLFDGMRIDHLLGFCGEWVIPWGHPEIEGKFEPENADEMAQLGKRTITALAQEAQKSGMLLIGPGRYRATIAFKS